MEAIQWSDLGVAIGLVFVIEGAAWALAPDLVRRLFATLLTEPVGRLRLLGGGLLVFGLLLVWSIRG